MPKKNPSRQTGNPAWKKASKVATRERPGSGTTVMGSSVGELEVAVQIASDAGDLSFFDFSVANNYYRANDYTTEVPAAADGKLELFIHSCAQASVHCLLQQIRATPVTCGLATIAHATEHCDRDVTVLPTAQAILERTDTHTVSIRLVSSEEMTGLNRDFRGKDGPTNVLSFAALDEQDGEFPVLEELLAETDDAEAGLQVPLGDLAICTDIVRTEAESQLKPALAHLAHMVVHGMLHLMGYDHESEQEAGIMESTEIVILGQLGFNNPYT